MSINDPILEMLSFAVENDLHILSAPLTAQQAATSTSSSCPKVASSSSLESSTTTTTVQSDIGEPAKKSSTGENNDFVKSSVLLGEEQELPCLFPTCSFRTCGGIVGDKKLHGEFLTHLLAQHKLVIENVEEIGNWSKYLSHWRSKLEIAPITDFCVGFVMDEVPKPEVRKPKKQNESQSGVLKDKSKLDQGLVPKPGKEGTPSGSGKADNMYFMLSPVLPEDSQLRKRLWKQRLDVVLEVNRQEREDACFSRRCLFCRDVVSGNRVQYFTHMRDSHHFHMGLPDNLVFIKELLQLIEDKLNRLECLFCDHIFKDKTVLKEHMRKKQHRQLNPKNSEYDRFYIVNYLEPGKTWETIQLEDTEDERKEDEWIEPTEEKERNVVCLFCKVANSIFSNILDHMKTDHKFDFLSITETLDFYQKIKLVNFIRRTVYQNACLCCEKRFPEQTSLLRHFQFDHDVKDSENVLLLTKQWNQPEYFFSTYDNDDFLTCLDSDDNVMKDDVLSSEDESNVIPEDLPHIDITNREFDLAGFAIRYHNQSS